MKHSSGNLDNSTRTSASQSPLVFEITQGRTESPLRPINRDRFLIGAGERCDLRLGGKDIPAVHSVVHIDGDEIWLETLADSPEVRVNGRLTRSAALEPGDELAIGSFCLTLHQTEAAQQKQTPKLYSASVSEILAEEEAANPLADVEELTARQLVDLIDQEEALIEEFEARRRLGAQALMDVVKQRFGEVDDDSEDVDEQPTPGQLLSELQAAIASLNEFAQDFEKRTERLSRQDTQRAANSLLDFQQQIVSRLDGVLEKIALIDDAESRQEDRRNVA